MVSDNNPETVNDWYVPLVRGVGSFEAWFAPSQLESLIREVEYLISYWLAVPIVPSSPGAVQARVIELLVVLDMERLDMAAGGVRSLIVVVGVTGIVVVGVMGGMVVVVNEEQIVLSLLLVEGPTMPVP